MNQNLFCIDVHIRCADRFGSDGKEEEEEEEEEEAKATSVI